jgi:hypothetical protein
LTGADDVGNGVIIRRQPGKMMFGANKMNTGGIRMETASHKNKKIFGILLMIAGIAGLLLPLMPGWILILAGFALL